MKLSKSATTSSSLLSKWGGGALAATAIAAALYFWPSSSPDQISGVINDYAAVTEVGEDFVNVDDPSAFSPGDWVLVIQMKGADVNETESTTYGDLSDPANAGGYEFIRLRDVQGNSLVFMVDLCKDYDVLGQVQVVRVPEYGEVEVVGELTPEPWNGQTGGVLVLWATDVVYLNDDIDAEGAGFIGGEFNGSSKNGGLVYGCQVSSGEGGFKGEGIASTAANGCRGKAANGGGGGNEHNGGGGGGSNYGTGGQGGHGWQGGTPGSDLDKGGRGGVSLAPIYASDPNRIILGGGGGGGHQNNGASIPAGDGGGIVFLVSPRVEVGTTVSILAGGEDAQDVHVNDGTSGGGGGGSLVLDVDSWVGAAQLTVDVSGGNGADLYTASQHGPGGGGGGGVIVTTQALPGDLITNLDGGEAGVFYSSSGSSNMHHNTTHGATPGTAGAVRTIVSLRSCSHPPTIDLDGEETGQDYQTECIVGISSPAISSGTHTAISDPDDVELVGAVIELINPLNGTDEGLVLTMSAPDLAALGITATPGVDEHTITLSGLASLADYTTVIQSIVYSNQAGSPDLSDRLVEVSVDDGGAWSNVAQTVISMSAPSFPVEWLSFEAKWEGQNASLSWATGSESQSDYFSVERSTDAVAFTQVGTVAAQGNSTTRSDYQFTDPAAGNNATLYYRLRQVDIDGAFSYSNTVELSSPGAGSQWQLSVYPNPANDIINVEYSGPQTSTGTTVRVMDLQGRTIQTIALPAPGAAVQVNVSGWPAGTYLLTVGEGGQSVSKRLVKQ